MHKVVESQGALPLGHVRLACKLTRRYRARYCCDALHWDRTARQQLELPLLHFYHEKLIRAGISSYSFDDLLLDYRRCLVRNLTVPILFWSRGQPRESWRYRLDHALAAYRDLECAELL